jgi:hypothetical protein
MTAKRQDPAAQKNHIVIGEGWAALATVGFLVQAQKPVVWIAHTRARAFCGLPSLERGPGVELWQRLAKGFGIELGAWSEGSFLREFRNKAFREPAWTKAPTPEARAEVLAESLWAPERTLVPLWESRFESSPNEIEEKIRALLTGDSEEGIQWRELIRRIDEVPVGAFKTEGDRVTAVVLGSGEEIACEDVFYADRWDALPRIQGLPKNLPFIRGREPASLLQAVFGHETAVVQGLNEGFFGALHKESGEEFERHVWGHFSSDGMRSYWTLCLTGDEVEDNHQIAKKLRRMKTALDKMFTGSSWLPEGRPEFMTNVVGEAVRFHEAVIFAGGEPVNEPVLLPSLQGACFLTDAYGLSCALRQVASALALSEAVVERSPDAFEDAASEAVRTDAEAKDVDLGGSSAS